MSHYIYENQNSKSFYSMSWIAFGLSFVGMLIGLIYMEADFGDSQDIGHLERLKELILQP